MRICDRCGGDEIVEKFVSKINGGEIDLCKACNEAFQEFLNQHDEPKRPVGRPPKEK